MEPHRTRYSSSMARESHYFSDWLSYPCHRENAPYILGTLGARRDAVREGASTNLAQGILSKSCILVSLPPGSLCSPLT